MPSRSDRDGLVEEITVSLLGIANKIAQVMAILKSAGLVLERPTPAGAKCSRLHMTDLGRASAQTARKCQCAVARALVGTASQAEAKVYLRFVERLETYHGAVADRWDPIEGDARPQLA
jgi:hypothetical protein